uniref:Nodulin-like protein n=1 Tax=Kalanchoe fedtschenkoi TaxID=63787 RepID=A0A7N1A875_KALFE
MDGGKWIATVASIWIQCTCGMSYAFGIYSSLLKSTQSYSQSTLDTVSVFKDIGANAGILSGLLYSAVAVRRGAAASSSGVGCRLGGPWVVHVAGAVQCFVGYFLMWLSVQGVIDRPPVMAMCLFMFLAAHAQTFFNTANVVTAVQNFPDYSGTIVGIMKGYLGLSGALLVQMYYAFCNGNPSTFILILALLPTVTTLLLMFLVKAYETGSRDDIKYLNGFSALSVAVAVYIMIVIFLENTLTIPSWGRIVLFTFLLLLVISPLKIAVSAQRDASQTSSSGSNLVDDSQLLVSEHTVDSPSASAKDHQDRLLLIGEDMNLLQAMSTLNFWLLSIAMACGLGSGLATVNNISQIGESLGYTTVERSNLVSLWSIWNFTGRFGAGYVSDYLLHTRGWPRPSIMAITLATMSIGHLIIAFGFTGNLYVGSLLVGVCYGSQWSLMPTITSEIFGVGHMGTIFNTIAVASPLGSYILSVRVVGYIYDKEAAGKGKLCLGTHCFMLSFLIMAFVMLFASFVALVLFYRTRRFYKMLVTRRLERTS